MSRSPYRRLVVALALASGALLGSMVIANASGGEDPSLQPEAQVAAPDVQDKWIAYNAKRRRQMAAYSHRHYGERTWKLAPRVIVEHFTASNSLSGTWNYFNANGVYNGERPGVCTHFIIDRDGSIYRLVPTDTRCRHVIGLNHRAIGIEMVGTSDRQIMGRARQYRAAQDRTLWLMQQHSIQLGDVIGHSESLNSPYHRERFKAWRCQTHADWSHKHMKRFRADLLELAQGEGVDVGDKVNREPSGCG